MPLAEELSPTFRVLVPELPGYSAKASSADLSYAATGRALVAMLAGRGADELHAIIGFSGGAYRAFHLALRDGVSVNVICGLGSLATLDEESREAFRQYAMILDRQPDVVTALEFRTLMAERMLSPAWRLAHPADVERVGDWLTLMTPEDLAAELRATAEMPDLRPELPKLRARVYLRVGELDVPTPVAFSRDIAALVPRATLDVVPGCGHALLIEDAAATIAAIEAFVARV